MNEDSVVRQLFNPAFLAGLGCGICFSVLLWYNKSRSCESPNTDTDEVIDEESSDEDGDGEIKLTLVVRSDLKMGKGKAAAQCAHAAVLAYQQAKKRKPSTLKEWEESGQRKIVVKCDSEEELLEVAKKARGKNLITSMIRDAGRTQIAAGSRTVLGVGPGPEDVIDSVTGHLKLY